MLCELGVIARIPRSVSGWGELTLASFRAVEIAVGRPIVGSWLHTPLRLLGAEAESVLFYPDFA